MKKSIVFFVTLVAVTSLAMSQVETSTGVKVGLNLATVGGSGVTSPVSMSTLYEVGLFDEIKIPGGFAIEPDVFYSVKGFSSSGSVSAFGFNYTISAKERSSYLDIPVLLKYYLPNFGSQFNVCAGPSIGFLLKAKVTAEMNGSSTETDATDQTTGTDIGLVLGMGIAVPLGAVDATVEARYDLGLKTLDESGNSNVYNRVFSILVGVSL
jgi:Outer membrane protein beta-barrel domain